MEKELDTLIELSKKLGYKEAEHTNDPYLQNLINVDRRILANEVRNTKNSILDSIEGGS